MIKKYIAYGSNLNLEQMSRRCPAAKVIAASELRDYKLVFNGVASIEKSKGDVVPVAVWEIDEESEIALDIYEGYPHLYRKENVEVEIEGKKTEAMVYIMNKNTPRLPSVYYFRTIQEGYLDIGLDQSILFKALENTEKKIKEKKNGNEKEMGN